MNKLGSAIYKYKKSVILVWVGIIVFFGFFALQLPSVLSGNGFEFDGEYKKTKEIIEEDFGQHPSSVIVLYENEGEASDEKWKSSIKNSFEKAEQLAADSVSPFQQEGMIKENIAYGVLMFDKEASSMSEEINDLRKVLKNTDGIKVSITGEPVIIKDLNQASQDDLAKAEMIGLPIALLVLVLAFGSLVAASLPLLVGIFSILTTMGAVYFFSYWFDLTIFILNIVPMIGLALSIDFALLFINRFKEEVNKQPVKDALMTTTATAGRSIIFSAMCVFIGLLGLMFIKIDIFQNVAIGGMTVVLISAVSAVTFLPAILGLLGSKVHSLSVLKVKSDKPGIWSTFAHFVMRRPVIMTLLALGLLIAGLLPVRQMELTVPGVDALPPTYDSRIAYDKFQDEFVDINKSSDKEVKLILETEGEVLTEENLEKLQSVLKKFEQNKNVEVVDSPFTLTGIDDPAAFLITASQENSPIQHVADAFITKDKMLASVYLKENLSAAEAQDLVREWADKEYDVSISFGGSPKFEQEIFDEIFKKAPQGLALILVSTFLILMVAFRSLLIPLKAIIMNILSLSATFGIVVWIFQEGHLGVDPTSIALILPVFVFSLVFGLSMDYEVFLISRIHEEYLETQDNNYATLTGLISTSKIISSAAAIMIVVTGAFAFTGVAPVKQMGVGIALAIFIDATVIRMVLVPSLMKLLGDWNWWFFGLKPSKNKRLGH
ncbi:MMPL family transporter [Mesobacillus subterraneus]|uniref:MMPL family transporter n=1 Tax=Mesobacillus subterraneus TaxID=285983 RepID=UPI00203BDA12|nr:MMPL family transporter [Mesobacillus subterraneus]MCM3682255.1 MMPL family transporter [Mesobacillus subterraneus]